MMFKQIYQSRKMAFLSLFFLLIPNLIFPMFSPNSSSSSTSSNIPSESFSALHPEFTDRDIEKVWEGAPIAVKNWANELKCQNGRFRNLPYRLYLYGDPGVGKTTLAYGIWLQNKPDWAFKRIAAGELINKHRGGAAQALNDQFNEILREKGKTIIVIDEAHMLMEGHEQEGRDTSETTEALKNFLDLHANDRNIMVILTGNDVSDMKESMRSRLIGSGVRIPLPTTQQLHKIFRHHAYEFSYDNIQKSDLVAMYRAAQIKSGRDIQTFMGILRNTVIDSGYDGRSLKDYQLSRDLFLRIAPLFRVKARDFGTGTKRLSEREDRQRLHDDGIRENRKNHEDLKSHSYKMALLSAASYVGYDWVKNKSADTKGNDINSTAIPEENDQASTQSESTQQSKRSNVGGVIKTAGAVGAVAVAATAGAASLGGAATTTAASAGMAAKVIAGGKVALALALAHPIIALGSVAAGVACYCCCSGANDDHEHED